MPPVPMWQAGGFYTAGCVVQHDGRYCLCRHDHIGGTVLQVDMAFGHWAVITERELTHMAQLAELTEAAERHRARNEASQAAHLSQVASALGMVAGELGMTPNELVTALTQEQAEAAFIAATDRAMREGQMARDNNRRPPASLADTGLEQTFNSVDRNMAERRQNSNRPAWRGPAARPRNQPVVLPNQPTIQRVNEDRAIVWSSSQTWRCPCPDGRMALFNIIDLDDKTIWTTIEWAIKTREAQHAIAIQSDINASMLGRKERATAWLAEQPAFLGLVNEAIRREFVFSDEIADFLESALAMRNVPTAEPWAQRQTGRTLTSIQSTVAARVHAQQHIETNGRAARPIVDLSEDLPG